MNVAEAICRAVAITDGAYEAPDELSDDEFIDLVALSPCPYPDPDDDGYPLIKGWEERSGVGDLLGVPYVGFLDLPEDQQLGLLQATANRGWTAAGVVAGDLLDALNYVRDVDINSNGHPKGAKSSKSTGDKWVSPGRLVLTWPDLDLTAVAVALVMAAHGNDKGENIWISQARIAEYLDRDRTTVYRAMKRLQERGVIVQTARPRQHKPATYRINRGPRVV